MISEQRMQRGTINEILPSSQIFRCVFLCVYCEHGTMIPPSPQPSPFIVKWVGFAPRSASTERRKTKKKLFVFLCRMTFSNPVNLSTLINMRLFAHSNPITMCIKRISFLEDQSWNRSKVRLRRICLCLCQRIDGASVSAKNIRCNYYREIQKQVCTTFLKLLEIINLLKSIIFIIFSMYIKQ